MRTWILCSFLLIGCYLATINASFDESCSSSERSLECCNPGGITRDATVTNLLTYIRNVNENQSNKGDKRRWQPPMRQINYRIHRLRLHRNRISARLRQLRAMRRHRRIQVHRYRYRNALHRCRINHNIRWNRWRIRSILRGKRFNWNQRRWLQHKFHMCRRRAALNYFRLIRWIRRRNFRRRRGCCCRQKSSRRSSDPSDKKDDEKKDEEEKKEEEEKEEDEKVEPEDENEAEAEANETQEERSEDEEKPKDCKTNSENCCSALNAIEDNSKVDDNLKNDAKNLMARLVNKVSEADDDTDAVALHEIFEDYIELHKCSADKGITGVETKKDLAEMLSMESPKLTLELFGNPQSYEEETEFILENVDDSIFGKDAYFCQEDKCEKYGKGEAESKLQGEVELFVPPNVKVKGEKRTYLPTAAYTLDKKENDKFTVEDGEKDTPKVIVDLEKESYSLAKDEKVSDLKEPSTICVSKKVKAELKSKGGEWTLDGETCATSVDEVTEIKVDASSDDNDDLYVFDISKEGNALPLQMKEFKNEKNKELLEKYNKFLGDSNKEELAIQFAKFPKDESICFGNGSVKQKTNEVPTDPPLDVVKCKESEDDKKDEEKKKEEKRGEKKHRINRNRYWKKHSVTME